LHRNAPFTPRSL